MIKQICVETYQRMFGNFPTNIFGKDGALSSIELIQYISEIEEEINVRMKKSISIMSDKAFSQTYSPFKDLESLSTFIESIL